MDGTLSLGNWIKMRRKALDMTQMGLAAAASCSVETIRKIEADALRPSRQLSQLLAECLGIPPDERPAFVRFARAEPALPGVSVDISSATRPTNLRPAVTPFIGREAEVDRVRDLLSQPAVRLITLTGPPGIGKTRLSLEAASGARGFSGGVYFVPLASVRDPELVLPSIASVLALRDVGSQPLEDALKRHLENKEMLLVLDNFEQVVDAAPLVSDLLQGAPGLKMLVSSRAVLRVYGEHTFAVPPMSLPSAHTADSSIEQLSRYEAVRLFVSRAQFASPDFTLTRENAGDIVRVCSLLDGLPLAIELAAGRSRTLSPHDLLSRLDRRLDLLSAGMRDLPARQRTLREAISWSDDLLTGDERAVFRRFSVFSGSCTLEAAEAVCSLPGPGVERVLDLLESLIDKSLLRRDDSGVGSRFSMLETIRDYALEKLEESGVGASARQTHLAFYLALAQRAEPQLQGSGQGEWLALLETELDNLRAALRNALDVGDVPSAALLGSSLRRFWYLHGHITEGRRWLAEILDRAGDLPPDLHAGTLHALGTLAWSQGDYPAARSLFARSLSIRRDLGDRRGIASMLNNLAVAALPQGDLDEAYALNEEALGLFRDLGDRWSEAMSLANLGLVATNRGEYDSAYNLLRESLEIRRSLGDRQTIAQSLNNLGTVVRLKGEYGSAYEFHREALDIFTALEDRWSIALSQANLGATRLGEGDYRAAAFLFQDALGAFASLGVKQGTATCLEGLAGVAAQTGRPDRAATLLGAAEALREEIGVPIPPSDRPAYDLALHTARDSAVQSRFNTAWTLGRAMGLDAVIALALAT